MVFHSLCVSKEHDGDLEAYRSRMMDLDHLDPFPWGIGMPLKELRIERIPGRHIDLVEALPSSSCTPQLVSAIVSPVRADTRE